MPKLSQITGKITVDIAGSKTVADVAVAYEVLGGVGAQRGTLMLHEVKVLVGDVAWLPAEGPLFVAVCSALTTAHDIGALEGK